MNRNTVFLILSLAAGALCFGGCAASRGVPAPAGVPVTQMNPDESGFVRGTGVESQDLVAVADEMARGILAISRIGTAAKPPSIVLEPVVNATRFPISPNLFLTRIRTQLNAQAAGRVAFLDRETMQAMQRERDLRKSSQPAGAAAAPVSEILGADYILTGRLEGLSTRTSSGVSDYILYSFRLTDARTSAIVWEGSAEIKKQGLEDAAYR